MSSPHPVLDTEGLDVTLEHLSAAVTVDPEEWSREIERIDQWYAGFGDSLPGTLQAQLHQLRDRFAHLPRISSR